MKKNIYSRVTLICGEWARNMQTLTFSHMCSADEGKPSHTFHQSIPTHRQLSSMNFNLCFFVWYGFIKFKYNSERECRVARRKHEGQTIKSFGSLYYFRDRDRYRQEENVCERERDLYASVWTILRIKCLCDEDSYSGQSETGGIGL